MAIQSTYNAVHHLYVCMHFTVQIPYEGGNTLNIRITVQKPTSHNCVTRTYFIVQTGTRTFGFLRRSIEDSRYLRTYLLSIETCHVNDIALL